MIPYGKQSLDEEDINEVVKVLKSDFLTTGPKIDEFEKKFADYAGSKYAVAVSSGTAALHLACLAAELKEEDEIITTPITFAASSNCALYCGAKPVFVDINEQGLIDENRIKEKITDKTKIIIPVHYSGLPCNMEKIKDMADKHKLIIIEDGCHSLGAKYKNSKIGSCKYSDMCVFSFHPVKHITTGEGGMITTNSKKLYDKLKILRTHGITKDPKEYMNKSDGPWYYEQQFLGYNYRITDIQSALGISQLKKLAKFVERRREIARMYDKAFKNNRYFDMPFEKEHAYSSYHLYPIKLKDGYKNKKKEIFSKMREKGLGVQVHFIPVYLQPYYRSLGYKKGSCPLAEDFYQKEISIPIYPSMTNKEVEYVIETIFGIFEGI